MDLEPCQVTNQKSIIKPEWSDTALRYTCTTIVYNIRSCNNIDWIKIDGQKEDFYFLIILLLKLYTQGFNFHIKICPGIS